jgi:hypothetical protein
VQGKKPIAGSRKFKTAQQRCTASDCELISIIKKCEEYKNIFLGNSIKVFTEHKNNIFHGLKASDCVLR